MNTMVCDEMIPQLQTLLKRQADGYRPGIDYDGRRHAVVNDGGGMAISFEIGVADTLHSLGLFAVTDELDGNSGGALVSAAIITGQLALIGQAVTKDIPEAGFVDKMRMLRGGPLIDLGVVRKEIEKLAFDVLDASPVDFRHGVTDLTNHRPLVISPRGLKPERQVTWLMRGLHLPGQAGDPTPDQSGVMHADAGLSIAMTEEVAMASEHIAGPMEQLVSAKPATEILRITPQVAGNWKNNRPFRNYSGRWMAQHGHKDSVKLLRDMASRQMQTINGPIPPHIGIIRPLPNVQPAGVLCVDPKVLNRSRTDGQNSALVALGYEVKGQQTPPAAKHNLMRMLGVGLQKTYFFLALRGTPKQSR
jgi:hypothetical protein